MLRVLDALEQRPEKAGRTMDDVDATRELAVAEAAGIRCCWMRRPSNEADMPSIYVMDGGWRVSTTNERATEESVKDYSDREEAIGDFVKRVHGFVEYQSDGSRRCPGGGRRQHVDVLVAGPQRRTLCPRVRCA